MEPTGPGEEPPRPTQDSFVTVGKRNLTSVLTLDAVVVAGATFKLLAPASGTLVAEGLPQDAVGAIHSNGKPVATLAVPAGARLRALLVPSGTDVARNYPVAEFEYIGFVMAADVPAEAMYRLYGGLGAVRAQVTRGPGPFECALLGGGLQASDTPDAGDAAPASGTHVLCAPPAGLDLVAGSLGLVAIETGSAAGVLALPVEAVAGHSQQGSVTVVDGAGRQVQKQIELGISDGAFVEVRNGLSEGDMVYLPAPNLGG